MTWFYAIPGWLGLLFVVAAFVSVACGGHALVHRRLRAGDLPAHNDVAGFLIAVVGVLYAVLLAFLTVIVWEHFAQSEARAQSEVDAATDVFRISRHVPAPDAQRLRRDLARYTNAMILDEWPKMHRGDSSPEGQRLIVALTDHIANLRPVSLQQANLQSRLLERVQVMADLRRGRIYDNGSGIPQVMWLALAIGAATVIAFAYLFSLKNFTIQLLMTAAIAIVIGTSFGLIMELDYPFRGDVSVSPERWIVLRDIIAGDTGAAVDGSSSSSTLR